jgi:hypothetical protein
MKRPARVANTPTGLTQPSEWSSVAKANRKSTAKAHRRRPPKKAPVDPAVESPAIGAPTPRREVPLPRYTLVDNTQRYSEEARAKLKCHILEHVENAHDVDLAALWEKLETAAEGYNRCVASLYDTPKLRRERP